MKRRNSVFFALYQLFLVLLVLVTERAQSQSSLNYRLDNTVLPDVYDITIKPYLLPEDGAKQFTFDGTVNITLHAVQENVKSIALHKDYLEISEALIYESNGQLRQNLSNALSYETETDILSATLSNVLQVGVNYTLYFRYVGQIRTGLAGFYRSSYTDSQGVQKWLGVTQSQRIDARTIVPCFDEPAMKAVFKMQISRPRSYTAYFNTRVDETTADGTDRYMDSFVPTPRMSTYLLAFVIADFAKRGNEVLSIITRPDYSSNTVYSQSVAVRTLAAYNSYTQLPYEELGNSVLQMLSVPSFPHNGMENWGLIIYRDDVLVNTPGYSDGWSNKQHTATIIAHETSHMWFGNSVTFSWWSYFWLNEAFARYYEYFFTHELYPEYQLDLQFTVNQMHLIFATDARNSTQPLTTDESLVQTPSQIANKFSAITYAKGACIVRMFRNSMGHENFDNAVRDYLRENHLQNTKPADLFLHLKRHWPGANVLNLDRLFHDWTEQVGYPSVHVILNDDGTHVMLQQKRFLLDHFEGSDPSLQYVIPITITDNVSANFTNLMPKFYMDQQMLGYRLSQPVDWVILNVQQTGYYRVSYDTPLLWKIRAALMKPQHSGIHVTNRAQLIDDNFNLALNDNMRYDLVFSFIEYLESETEYTPWYAAFNGMQRVVMRTPLEKQPLLGKFILDVTEKVYKKLRFSADHDTVLDVYNRKKVATWRCKYASAKDQCTTDALNAFNSGIPSTDVRETVYCSSCRVGDAQLFEKLYKRYTSETVATEREMMARALACTRDQSSVLNYFDRILGSDVAYKQTVLNALCAENPENVTPVFTHMTEKVELMAAAFGSWSTTATIISNCANYFTSEQQKDALTTFIETKGSLFGTAVSVLRTALVNVEENIHWTETRLIGLYAYLENRNGASVNSLTAVLMLLVGIVYTIVM